MLLRHGSAEAEAIAGEAETETDKEGKMVGKGGAFVVHAAGAGKRQPLFAGERSGEDVVAGVVVGVEGCALVGIGGEEGELGGERGEGRGADGVVEEAREEDAVGGGVGEMVKEGLRLGTAGGLIGLEMCNKDGEGLAVGHAESGVEEDAPLGVFGIGEEDGVDGEGTVLGEEGDAVGTVP